MPSRKNILSVCFSLLSLTQAWLFVNTQAPEFFGTKQITQASSLQALLTGKKITLESIPWKTVEPQEMDSGLTAPAGTNVVFTIPGDAAEMRREVLFSDRGRTTRYWGYCFDANYDYDRGSTVAESGFPGKLFLSEAERAWRKLRQEQEKPVFTIYNVPKNTDLEPQVNGPIRHQIEIFTPGTTCYVMTEKPLPIGTDRDNDRLNVQAEKSAGTDPLAPDTDGDGVLDGVEVLISGTEPLKRDTDGDGLIDGLEDANHNGKTEVSETDPLKRDTDSDTLCDGFCRQFTTSEICADNNGQNCKQLGYGRWMGEDKNLNGKLDTGETNPRLWSTPANGISDLQQYYKCILAGGKDC